MLGCDPIADGRFVPKKISKRLTELSLDSR